MQVLQSRRAGIWLRDRRIAFEFIGCAWGSEVGPKILNLGGMQKHTNETVVFDAKVVCAPDLRLCFRTSNLNLLQFTECKPSSSGTEPYL